MFVEKAGIGGMSARHWTRRLSIGAVVIALLYAAACAYMWATQRDHVFEPELLLQTTPDRLGMKFEELRIPVGSGVDQGELYGWWVPAERQLRHVTGAASRLRELLPSRAAITGESVSERNEAALNAPTILYLHGNYRNIGNNLEHTLRLHKLGFNVLLPDYRGFGKSSGGKPNEAKVYEDAEAAWQYLLKQRGVQPGQAFIYGHSLGGAIAIDLATHHPEAAGLITESTFTSMAEMGKLSYAYLPVDWLLNQRFESLKKIAALKVPVLLIHGTWDKTIPVKMAQQLYAAAPQPKTLTLIEGGEHNNSAAVGLIEYRDAVMAFVKQNTH
jgi:pimeloyl-ACP methyl ester carboxylesterase